MTMTIHSPAPGDAEHPSLALANSAGASSGGRRFDELATPESATGWIVAHDLAAPDVHLRGQCQGRLTELRDAVRDIMTAHLEGVEPTGESVRVLNDALTSAPGAMRLHFQPGIGFIRVPEHPATQVVEHVMAVIAEDAAALMTGDEAATLAVCEADSCDRFFLRAHARRRWCSTRCGDRVRAARAHARKRAALSGQPA
ncbi:ABATE domain-containing protein [Microbacterium sp. Sa4CUA7]|uniref:ABATE domain-containing protein n=1 Tax=Microbacterium pullorum TaxID=2762236 RepID=A0ABR8S022_9MICO|nr:CGNR zinc finger domain-containing protein [Microbacterium pullorum]MBD7956833.1 ABATE domain-containing protein [Microbacterium pullorum]